MNKIDSLLNILIDKQTKRLMKMGAALRQVALATTIEEAHKIANVAINEDHELP